MSNRLHSYELHPDNKKGKGELLHSAGFSLGFDDLLDPTDMAM